MPLIPKICFSEQVNKIKWNELTEVHLENEYVMEVIVV